METVLMFLHRVCITAIVSACAFSVFSVMSAFLLRQAARCLPHQKNEPASKIHLKSTDGKIKTVSKFCRKQEVNLNV